MLRFQYRSFCLPIGTGAAKITSRYLHVLLNFQTHLSVPVDHLSAQDVLNRLSKLAFLCSMTLGWPELDVCFDQSTEINLIDSFIRTSNINSPEGCFAHECLVPCLTNAQGRDAAGKIILTFAMIVFSHSIVSQRVDLWSRPHHRQRLSYSTLVDITFRTEDI